MAKFKIACHLIQFQNREKEEPEWVLNACAEAGYEGVEGFAPASQVETEDAELVAPQPVLEDLEGAPGRHEAVQQQHRPPAVGEVGSPHDGVPVAIEREVALEVGERAPELTYPPCDQRHSRLLRPSLEGDSNPPCPKGGLALHDPGAALRRAPGA